MKVNISLIVLAFIIVVAIIVLSDSTMSAMILVSLLANFLVISLQLHEVSETQEHAENRPGVEDADTNTSVEAPPVAADPDRYHSSPYGVYHNNWRAYKTSYDLYEEPYPVVNTSYAERSNGVDAANCLMAQRRARDKKCADGAASKDAHYFRHHYANELDEEEAKPWWGRAEI